ncbi:hypothetical protein [Celeribacter sp.]|uniref:hypothetical protein n=1 Tax=Celeribacter sp. TaxID=1890673 RepID=UPI003A9051A7
MVVVRDVPRDKDLRLLEMLARRRAGESLVSIARDMGLHSGNVSAQTCKIRDADQAHDPDDFDQEGYW